MIHHPPLRVLCIDGDNESPRPLMSLLAAELPHFSVRFDTLVPADLSSYDAVISGSSPLSADDTGRLLYYVKQGGGWLVLAGPDNPPLAEGFGVRIEAAGPTCELRVMFKRHDHPLSVRLPDAAYITMPFQALVVVDQEAEVLLYTDWYYTHRPLFTLRTLEAGSLACTTISNFNDPMVRCVVHRLLREWQHTAPQPGRELGVGILGYAPSVGRTHGLAIGRTPGLRLAGVCDLSRERLNQAQADFSGITLYDSAQTLAESDDIDLVIVATAPSSHALLSIQMLTAGKHVLCEKPLALTVKEVEAMREAAELHNLHLSCHQNRRWDPDFRAISRCIQDGRMGEVFHVETFVGGFGHPCGYWHSHQPVSGGTSYDWGAHYLDWLMGLIPDAAVEAVSGTRHKRVWHDVTNADMETIRIRFSEGREAEFIHSDIAAAVKPKWYILGTKGALVGHWRDVTAYSADPLYYFTEDDIPPTEMVPHLTLYPRAAGGDIEPVSLAMPKRDPYAFHRNLASHLFWGEPLAAPLADSMKVVAILEAAARSMTGSGRWEHIDGI